MLNNNLKSESENWRRKKWKLEQILSIIRLIIHHHWMLINNLKSESGKNQSESESLCKSYLLYASPSIAIVCSTLKNNNNINILSFLQL